MTTGNRIQHVNLMVDDLTAADTFYTEVLGLERAPTPEMGFPAQFYKVNESQELHVNELEDTRPGRAHFCLRVDDFNTLFARANDLGIIDTATWGNVKRLPTGVMQLFVKDPSGNLIELACDADQPIDAHIFELDFVDGETQSLGQSSQGRS